MKVCISSKGEGGCQIPNLNFLDLILVELINLVTDKLNPIFGLNFRGEGGLKKFRRNTHFHFFLWITSLTCNHAMISPAAGLRIV